MVKSIVTLRRDAHEFLELGVRQTEFLQHEIIILPESCRFVYGLLQFHQCLLPAHLPSKDKVAEVGLSLIDVEFLG